MYGHTRQKAKEKLSKKNLAWIPNWKKKLEEAKDEMGTRSAMKARDLEEDDWLNKKDWCGGCNKWPGRL